eukprot:5359872-Pyramimonas_sp.AAC.1
MHDQCKPAVPANCPLPQDGFTAGEETPLALRLLPSVRATGLLIAATQHSRATILAKLSFTPRILWCFPLYPCSICAQADVLLSIA